MSNRIEKCLQDIKLKGKKAIIGALVPDIQNTDDLINMVSLKDAGLDMIILKVPFSDPLADGPVVQILATRAVNNNTSPDYVLGLVKSFKEKSDVPVILSVYLNTLNKYGNEKFVEKAKECGVDGLIVPDLSCEEKELLSGKTKGITLLMSVTPYSLSKVDDICKSSEGFITVTSTRANVDELMKEMENFSAVLNASSSLPVISGIEVFTPSEAAGISKRFDGIIVASSLMSVLDEFGIEAAKELVMSICSHVN